MVSNIGQKVTSIFLRPKMTDEEKLEKQKIEEEERKFKIEEQDLERKLRREQRLADVEAKYKSRRKNLEKKYSTPRRSPLKQAGDLLKGAAQSYRGVLESDMEYLGGINYGGAGLAGVGQYGGDLDFGKFQEMDPFTGQPIKRSRKKGKGKKKKGKKKSKGKGKTKKRTGKRGRKIEIYL